MVSKGKGLVDVEQAEVRNFPNGFGLAPHSWALVTTFFKLDVVFYDEATYILNDTGVI